MCELPVWAFVLTLDYSPSPPGSDVKLPTNHRRLRDAALRQE